jgi:hypothetical protein
MVRSREAASRTMEMNIILRDAAKWPLLRMREVPADPRNRASSSGLTG